MYLLDTNIVSYWMRGDAAVIARIRLHSPSVLALATVTLAEIHYGIEKSPVRKKERESKIQRIASELEILSFDENAARAYGGMRAYLERKGRVISERDLQIAAIARAHNRIVVTHNVKEFGRIPRLKVEDWAIKNKT